MLLSDENKTRDGERYSDDIWDEIVEKRLRGEIDDFLKSSVEDDDPFDSEFCDVPRALRTRRVAGFFSKKKIIAVFGGITALLAFLSVILNWNRFVPNDNLPDEKGNQLAGVQSGYEYHDFDDFSSPEDTREPLWKDFLCLVSFEDPTTDYAHDQDWESLLRLKTRSVDAFAASKRRYSFPEAKALITAPLRLWYDNLGPVADDYNDSLAEREKLAKGDSSIVSAASDSSSSQSESDFLLDSVGDLRNFVSTRPYVLLALSVL